MTGASHFQRLVNRIMANQRSICSLQQWSRHLTGAIALLGASETAWLNAVEFSGNTAAACPTTGCQFCTVLMPPFWDDPRASLDFMPISVWQSNALLPVRSTKIPKNQMF